MTDRLKDLKSGAVHLAEVAIEVKGLINRTI